MGIVEWLSTLVSSPWLNGAGFLLGVVSFVLFLVYRRRDRPRTELRFATRGTEVITSVISAFGGVQLPLRSEPITTLTISEIIVWNAGNRTIHQNQIANQAPIRIEPAQGAAIYGAKLSKTDNRAMNVQIEEKGGEYTFHFDFLEPRNAFIIQVVHSANDPQAISLSGHIIEGKQPRRSWPPFLPLHYRTLLFVFIFIALVVLPPLIIRYMFPWITEDERLAVKVSLVGTIFAGSVLLSIPQIDRLRGWLLYTPTMVYFSKHRAELLDWTDRHSGSEPTPHTVSFKSEVTKLMDN